MLQLRGVVEQNVPNRQRLVALNDDLVIQLRKVLVKPVGLLGEAVAIVFQGLCADPDIKSTIFK